MLKFVLTKRTLPTRSRVISLIPLWLLQLKTLLGEGLINFRILFLKSTKRFEFRRVGSKLFHSMIVEGKKEFLKKLCLILKQGMLSTFLVAYAWVFWGISLKRYWGLLFLQIQNECSSKWMQPPKLLNKNLEAATGVVLWK